MTQLYRTVFFDRHIELRAKMVEFAGWNMPLHYKPGILQEHLATRKRAGRVTPSVIPSLLHGFSAELRAEFYN